VSGGIEEGCDRVAREEIGIDQRDLLIEAVSIRGLSKLQVVDDRCGYQKVSLPEIFTAAAIIGLAHAGTVPATQIVTI
jgi:hypothetical protein